MTVASALLRSRLQLAPPWRAPAPNARSLAGHSHYHNTRHRKAAVDAQRSSKLTKVARELYAAIAQGGVDASLNPRLARALASARRANMPNVRIERALKSAGGRNAQVVEPSTYDISLPHGIAVRVRALPIRPKGLAAELRSIARRANGDLAKGKVQHLFYQRLAVVANLPATQASSDATLNDNEQLRERVILMAMDCNASDFSVCEEDGAVEFACESAKVRDRLADELKKAFPDVAHNVFTVGSVEPVSVVDAVDQEHEETLQRAFEALDEHDEVVEIVHNANV